MRQTALLIFITLLFMAAAPAQGLCADDNAFPPQPEPAPAPEPPAPASNLTPADVIDFPVLANNSAALAGMHRQRTVDVETFLAMAGDEDTVLLDVRSAWEYQCAHVEGALNMSVADITADTMKRIAPARDTRIVIYCSNSLYYTPMRRIALTSMAFPLLFELGYSNVYQLQPGHVSGRGELARLPIVAVNPPPPDQPGRYHCSSARADLGMSPLKDDMPESGEQGEVPE